MMNSTRTALLGALCATTLAASVPAREAKPADPGKGAVAAAHPVAAEAGAEILAMGGNAVDAAIAVSLTLGVVEPQASGLGGGGFMLIHDAATGELDALDYRERAPAAYDPAALLQDGKYDEDRGTHGALSIGVPGLLPGLLEAHERHGSLPLEVLVAPAVRAAGEGFEVYPFLAESMASSLDMLSEDEASAALYLEDGIFPYDVGSTFTNAALATTLSRIPAEGAAVLHSGDGAAAIAAAVQAAGGVLTAGDMQAVTVHPLGTFWGTYHGYRIVAPGSPSAGGVKVIATLKLMDEHRGPAEADSPHGLLAAALCEVTSAADAWVADPLATRDRSPELLMPAWQSAAQKRIAAPAASASVPRMPADVDTGKTTHFSIVDAQGNVVSGTQTINYFFGAGITVPELGFILNNQLADFTFEPGHPNEPGAGKVPRSNMAPMLVYHGETCVGAIGSPGGPRIPATLVQVLMHLVDEGATLQEAVDAPRLFVDPERHRISHEDRLDAPAVQKAAARLAAAQGKEWGTSSRDAFDKYFGGVHAVWIEGGAQGAADPRRAGAVRFPQEIAEPAAATP